MAVKKTNSDDSFFSQLKASTLQIFIGAFLFLASVYGLHYNEGSYVAKMKLLQMAFQRSTYLDLSYKSMFEDKLVHHSGYLTSKTGDTVDTYFGISFPCLKLKRSTEMYQYQEHNREEENNGETTTTYYYEREWSSILIDSRNFDQEFGHQNPKSFLIESKLFQTDNAFMDGIRLSGSLLEKVNNFQEIQTLPVLPYNPQYPVQYYENYYYLGHNSAYPQIGDIRVKYSCAGITQNSNYNGLLSEKFTIVAKYNKGDYLSSYRIHEFNGNIELLHYGDKSIDQVFADEHTANNAQTWMCRIIGFLAMFASFYLMTKIVHTLVSWIPLVRNVVSAGLFTLNLSCAFFISLVVISLSWLWFRPALSAALGLVALTPWILSFVLTKAKVN